MVDKVILIAEIHSDLDKIGRYLRALQGLEVNTITLESPPLESLSSLFPLVPTVGLEDFSDTFTATPTYFSASLRIGAEIAALLYQKNEVKKGNKILMERVDIPVQELDKLLEELKCPPPSPLQEKAILEELYAQIVTLNACGMERISRIKNFFSLEDENMPDLIVHSYSDIIRTGSIPDIKKASEWSDCLYLLSSEVSEQSIALGKLEERDTFATQKICQMNGTIVHLGGYAHIYGNYNNLYQQLKAQGISVERIKLLDFAHQDPAKQDQYQKYLETLVTEIKTEAQSVLDELR